MPIDRPKILTRFTVPTGGWTLTATLEYGLGGANQFTCTVAAGDYYVAWDAQTSDFLWELASKFNAAGKADEADWTTVDEGIMFWIDSDHKVHMGFNGAYFGTASGQEILIEWTQTDGVSIGNVLGFDTTADLQLTGVANPTATANYHHAYGWYADDDGMLEFLSIEPTDTPRFEQSFAPSGHSKVQYLGSRFENELRLNFIPRTKTWSRDVAYTETPVYPYAQNEPLECWWQEARQGIEFRIYRQNTVDTSLANIYGIADSSTATTLTDADVSLNNNPDEWAGKLMIVGQDSNNDWWAADVAAPMRWYVSSHTTTVITVAQQQEPQFVIDLNSDTYYLLDQGYQTYVVDLSRMRGGFSPDEIPNIDKFKIKIPLVRYEP